MLDESVRLKCQKLADNDSQGLRNIYPEFLDTNDIDLGRQKYSEVCKIFIHTNPSSLKFVVHDRLPNGVHDYVSMCEDLISKSFYNLEYVELDKLLNQKALYKELCKMCKYDKQKELNLFKSIIRVDWLPNGEEDVLRLLNGDN